MDSIATYFDGNDEAESDDGPRQLQLNAFVAVDSNMNVTYSHYCKTIADFPSANDLIKNL